MPRGQVFSFAPDTTLRDAKRQMEIVARELLPYPTGLFWRLGRWFLELFIVVALVGLPVLLVSAYPRTQGIAQRVPLISLMIMFAASWSMLFLSGGFKPGRMLFGYTFWFPTLPWLDLVLNRSLVGGRHLERKTLESLGFISGDIIVTDQDQGAPASIGYLVAKTYEAMSAPADFEDFLWQVIREEKCLYRPRWAAPRPGGHVPCIYGVALYTEEDLDIAAYVRQHHGALHAMTSFAFNLYVFESMPRDGVGAAGARHFWLEHLKRSLFEAWSALGLTDSKPHMTAAVYDLARNIAISTDEIPCIVLFTRWGNISSDRIVVPIRGDPSRFFRDLCAAVNTTVATKRGARSIAEYASSCVLEDFREELLQFAHSSRASDPKHQVLLRIGELYMAPKYQITGGHQGAVGDYSRADHFTQIWHSIAGGIELDVLATELDRLRTHASSHAKSEEDEIVISELASAEAAARRNDGPRVLQHLASAGKWASELATKIGADVAVEAIKKATGLG